jgi:hypothetical protein
MSKVYALWFVDLLFESHMQVSVHRTRYGAENAKDKHWNQTLKKHQEHKYPIDQFDNRYRWDIVEIEVLP